LSRSSDDKKGAKKKRQNLKNMDTLLAQEPDDPGNDAKDYDDDDDVQISPIARSRNGTFGENQGIRKDMSSSSDDDAADDDEEMVEEEQNETCLEEEVEEEEEEETSANESSPREARDHSAIISDLATGLIDLGARFKCSICMSMFSDAARLDCNHAFCRGKKFSADYCQLSLMISDDL
jgi:hypothetical protein